MSQPPSPVTIPSLPTTLRPTPTVSPLPPPSLFLPPLINSTSVHAPLTITRTFFKTSTLPPTFATHTFTSFSTPSFLTIPYTETTLTTTQVTLTTYTSVPTPMDESWDRLFPALIVFALIGLLAIVTGLAVCVFCLFHHRFCCCCLPGHKKTPPPSPSATADRLAIGRTSKESSPTFIPIESSPLTLVPRAAIWQDPDRRRGVDELDLWERKQHLAYDEEMQYQPFFPPPPPTQQQQQEEEEEEQVMDDRPWQRYAQNRPQPLSDLAHAITLAALHDDDDDDEHSLRTISRNSLRPISYLHQDVDQHGLEGSGSSQWLCPPASTFRK